MFDAEESLIHLQELRCKAAVIKGEAVEGLSPIVLEEENTKAAILNSFPNKRSLEMDS